MSGKSNHPVPVSAVSVDGMPDSSDVANWTAQSGEGPPPDTGPKFQRYLSALNRFKWLIIVLTVLGGVGGYVATGFIDPQYQVEATISMGLDGSVGAARGQDDGLMDRGSWQDLLKTYTVADPVVNRLQLYLSPDKDRDSTVFRDFQVTSSLIPGDYTLKVTGRSYKLLANSGFAIDSGAVGDSIGRNRGFMWQPSSQELAGHNDVRFTVKTPREASRALLSALVPDQRSTFLKLTLTGKNSQRLAATLNALTEQFVAEATALKKKKVTSLSFILNGQRDYQANVLAQTERALQDFRVRTVTMPNEREQPINGGTDLTTSPAFNDFFQKKYAIENLQRDRSNLERMLDSTTKKGSGLTVEAVRSIPSINTDPAAQRVLAMLDEQSLREQNLRKLQEQFTDANEQVIQERAALENIRFKLVPREVAAYLAQLQAREKALNENIVQSGASLQDIPKRTIEEARLKRAVDEAVAAYSTLDMQAHQAQLAEASTIPDVSILDPAVAPLFPTRNTAPVLILGAVGASLALGVLLAVLLDQTDKRFRYPEQATDDLGLAILGVVPIIGGKGRRKTADQAAQVVETFRSIRMNVRYATEAGRSLTLTVTSPGPNDGKSLISANLALSFAESGARTLLIDGDIRRGELSKTFGTKSRPGLVEYLDGAALIAEVLQPTASHANLTIMPAGARRRRAPELLATPKLPQLINQLSKEFDVIIMDSPPFGAGFDAFALGAATGNMAVVLRAGVTNRKMAKAKLDTVATLPINVIGAILNSIELTGAYQYYSYYQDYAAEDEDPVSSPQRLPAGIERVDASSTARKG
jgi:succinoglycan biosynthesis transport protein ExoP